MRKAFAFASFLALTAAMTIQSAVPQSVNYRGRLVDAGGAPVDTTLNMTFRIYDAPTQGTTLWAELQTAVVVSGGLFTVNLGSGVPLGADVFSLSADVFLGIQVGADPEISPRTKFTPVGYAHVADRANVALRSNSSNFADSTEAITDGAVDFTDVGQNGATEGQLMKWSGSAWVAADDAISATASGWLDSGTVVRLETSTDSVGIGTATPAAELDVKGDFLVSGKATIGPGHTNSGTNSFVVGQNNTASGAFATSGGASNIASGIGSTVSGGANSTASGNSSVIGGGASNQATQIYSVVAGGVTNFAIGSAATVGGGSGNRASASRSTVGGGESNRASGTLATVGGGQSNRAGGGNATVGGGASNIADNLNATVGGGLDNFAGGDNATVGGGASNRAIGIDATVGGGKANSAAGLGAIVGGGIEDTASSVYSGVFSGFSNLAGDAAADTAAFVGGGRDNSAINRYSTIGGGNNNTARGVNSTVAGGMSNTAGEENSSVGGGENNLASGIRATVAGGGADSATGQNSTVSGGQSNTASGPSSTIGGGRVNTASDFGATVCGGSDNIASGVGATVPGGISNSAVGTHAFAAGRQAKANHNGTFVWADAIGFVGSDFASTAPNQFLIRATGGTSIYSNTALSAGVTLATGASSWAAVSDSALKRNIREVDYYDVLEKVASLSISQWSYEAQDESIEHIGPMAQDFYRLFGLGEDNKHINTLDPDGVALAAIKALYEKSKRVDALEARLEKIEKLLEKQN